MMRGSILMVACAILVACGEALPQVKGVKGGHDDGRYPYFQNNQNLNNPQPYPGPPQGQTIEEYLRQQQQQQHQQQNQHQQPYPINIYHGTNIPGRFFNNGSLVAEGQTVHNNSRPRDFEIGVCYIEVLTARLAKDPAHVPAGNGSTPEFSRVRSCCQGYIRNIHNFKICDPVCTEECVNGLCTAPNVCTCFPDHVRNQAGFCVPICPVGCQNGKCAGGECICDQGYTLDDDSKYCKPVCLQKCGGIGNCTAPNTCSCKPGFVSGKDGSCVPPCDSCQHGECIGPNQCRCRPGYVNSGPGSCVPSCTPDCGPNRQCLSPNNCSPCPPGFENDVRTGRCVRNEPQIREPKTNGPTCDRQCINGICLDSNECVCNPGYVKDINFPDGSRCIPHCAGGCTNGVCTLPNHCICNMGFVKDFSVKGRPACVRRVRRSADPSTYTDEKKAGELGGLIFDIPDY